VEGSAADTRSAPNPASHDSACRYVTEIISLGCWKSRLRLFLAKPSQHIPILDRGEGQWRPLAMRKNLDREIRKTLYRWEYLDPYSRAQELRRLRKLGASRRHVARQLGCSEGLLRHIEKLLDLSPELTERFRSGGISIRRAVESVTRPVPVKAKPIEPPRQPTSNAIIENSQTADAEDDFHLFRCSVHETFSAQQVSQMIVAFVCGVYAAEGPYLAQPIWMSRVGIGLYSSEYRSHPLRPLAPGLTFIGLIKCSMPTCRLDPLTRVSNWLACWVFLGVPDRDIRDEALKIAEAQLKTMSTTSGNVHPIDFGTD
jgi:hypothetical protein